MFEWRKSVHYCMYWWSYISFAPARMQRINLHARPSIIQVGCPTCCYPVCALDHANGGTEDLDYPSEPSWPQPLRVDGPKASQRSIMTYEIHLCTDQAKTHREFRFWFDLSYDATRVHRQMLRIARQIWGIRKLRPAYSPETPNLGLNRSCSVPCDLEIWWMTLENNRASLLCCSSFV